MDKLYTAEPDGYCGDEDNGQTSAWYVFSALGFYPVCPGTDQYIIGTPLFKEATVQLAGGKKLTIKASNGDLTKGAYISFQMSDTPDTTRATAPESRPYSFSLDK